MVQITLCCNFQIKYFETRCLDTAVKAKREFKNPSWKLCNFQGLMQPTALLETFALPFAAGGTGRWGRCPLSPYSCSPICVETQPLKKFPLQEGRLCWNCVCSPRTKHNRQQIPWPLPKDGAITKPSLILQHSLYKQQNDNKLKAALRQRS